MGVSWTWVIVDGLLLERERGEVEFARAWRHAEARARSLGVTKPRALRAPEDEGLDWLPFAAFFRRACLAEWEGRVRTDYAGLRRLLERNDEPVPLGTERVTLVA